MSHDKQLDRPDWTIPPKPNAAPTWTDDFTPTTVQVRANYIGGSCDEDDSIEEWKQAGIRFDRWLAATIRQAKADLHADLVTRYEVLVEAHAFEVDPDDDPFPGLRVEDVRELIDGLAPGGDQP